VEDPAAFARQNAILQKRLESRGVEIIDLDRSPVESNLPERLSNEIEKALNNLKAEKPAGYSRPMNQSPVMNGSRS
jgi:hypothetical protein